MLRNLLRRTARAVAALFLGKRRRHRLVGDVRLWRMKREFQIGFLKTQGLQPHHTLMDIGCGTLRGGIPIIEYLEPDHYVGIDAREAVLDEARAELASYQLNSKRPRLIHEQRLASLDLATTVDYIWAFSVLFHLTDELLEECFTCVQHHLKPGGVFLANVSLGERRDGTWQGFPVRFRPLDHYRRLADARGFDLTDLGPLVALGHRSGLPEQDQQRMLRMTPRIR